MLVCWHALLQLQQPGSSHDPHFLPVLCPAVISFRSLGFVPGQQHVRMCLAAASAPHPCLPALTAGCVKRLCSFLLVKLQCLCWPDSLLNPAESSACALQVEAPAKDGAFIHGLTLEGARWDERSGALEDSRPKELFCPLPVSLALHNDCQHSHRLQQLSELEAGHG